MYGNLHTMLLTLNNAYLTIRKEIFNSVDVKYRCISYRMEFYMIEYGAQKLVFYYGSPNFTYSKYL